MGNAVKTKNLGVAALKRAILDEFDASHKAEYGGMPDSRRLDPDQVKSDRHKRLGVPCLVREPPECN